MSITPWGPALSAEIINLRRVRKAAARTDRDAEAAGNRVRHGRGKAERAALALETGRATRLLDGARLDGSKLDGTKLDGSKSDGDRREPPPADGD